MLTYFQFEFFSEKSRWFGKAKTTWDLLTDKSVLRPFILLDFIFFFCTISSMIPVKPYLVNVLREVGTPFEPKWALVCYIIFFRIDTRLKNNIKPNK